MPYQHKRCRYKIVLFEKLSLSKKGFKYFIGYNGDEEVKS